MLRVSQNNSSIQQPSCRSILPESNHWEQWQPQCPKCAKKASNIMMYGCCFEVVCDNCYSNLHYVTCQKKDRSVDKCVTNVRMLENHCERCEEVVGEVSYSCKECQVQCFCQLCFDRIHNSPKFQMHYFKKNNIDNKSSLINILNCTQHKKTRNIVTEGAELVCVDCANCEKLHKFRCIDFQEPTILKLIHMQLLGLFQEIEQKDEQLRNKWNQMKKQLNAEYEKLCTLLKERYDQNMAVLNKIQDDEMRVVNKALIQSKKAKKQCSFEYSQVGISSNLMMARMGILCCQLHNEKKCIKQQTELNTLKIGCMADDKFRNLLKSWTVYKSRLREMENKKKKQIIKLSQSFRKSYTSSSSSQTKNFDKGSVMIRSRSTLSINRSSQNQSQEQRVQSYVPTLSYKIGDNVDNISMFLNKSSNTSKKLEDLSPLMLNLDVKKAKGNGGSLPLAKNEQDYFIGDDLQQCKATKPKMYYFDLRSRMRKTSAISMVNNEQLTNK